MKTLLFLLLFPFIIIPFSHSQNLDFERFASNLDRPSSIKHTGYDKLYVAEQDGFIKLINNDGTVNTNPFLNIDDSVISINNLKGKGAKRILENTEIIQKVNTTDLSIGIYILEINLKNGEQSTHKLVIC
ncbi:hypothetical protein [Winogradskyella sp. R77965]|uniref:hypothetical protein n=1 Tax=Winogradskyella sp. R77965 TaxID=3093872 RepID=UPI0037DC10A6